MSDKFEEKFRDTIDDIKRRLNFVAKRIEEYLDRGEIYKAYRVWRDAVLDSLKILRKTLDTIVEELKSVKLSEEELQRLTSYIKDGVREIVDRIEDIGDRIRENRNRKIIVTWFGFKPFRHMFHDIIGGVGLTVDRILDSIEKLVEDIEKSVEDIGKRTTQVVSIRVRGQDLEIIDKLVDSGIFRSRSEAISYFARKGIEVSRDWIEKALNQAKKIKELQEEIRREIKQENQDEEEKDHNK